MSKVIAQFYICYFECGPIHLAIVNMVRTVKKLHYSLLLHNVVTLIVTQMVSGNCEHVANLKETVLFFAILQCGSNIHICIVSLEHIDL